MEGLELGGRGEEAAAAAARVGAGAEDLARSGPKAFLSMGAMD